MTFDAYPCSSAQKRLFLVNRLYGDNIVYNIPHVWIIEGHLEKERLEQALLQMIDRHETLRTCFAMKEGDVFQKVYEEFEFRLTYTHAPGSEIETLARQFLRPFDLGQVPLWRAELVQLAENRQLFLFDIHHTVADGTSMGVLLNDLMVYYNDGQLEELEYQYVDFTMWQNEMFEGELIEKQGQYWLDVFSGEIPVLDLPFDFPRGDAPILGGESIDIYLDRDMTAAVNRLAVKFRTTLFAVLLASYNILLSRYSDQEDIVVGSPISGRTHKEFESIIGMFVNTLALRNKPYQAMTAGEFIQQVSENVFSAFNNQDYPFELLVEKLVPQRQLNRNPLMSAFFVLQNFDNQIETTDNRNNPLKIIPYHPENRTAKFDLTLTAFEMDDRLLFKIEYPTALFRRSTIERFGRHFTNLIRSLSSDHQQVLGDIDILDTEERKRMLFELNMTDAGYPASKTIHRLFEEQVQKTPSGIAVHTPVRVRSIASTSLPSVLTYRELNRRAEEIAAGLVKRGSAPGTIVALLLRPSTYMIAAVLAVLKAGAAYLPLDPEHPAERRLGILKDSAAQILLTDVPSPGESGEPGNLQDWNGQVTTILETPDIGGPLDAKDALPVDTAYIIYTSGSTGKPKGVMIEHRQVVRLMKNDRNLFDFSAHDSWTLFHSYCFDFSVWEMYGALLFGGTLHVFPRQLSKDTGAFLDVLVDEKVTVLNQTPSAFYNLIEFEKMRRERETNPEPLNVRYVIFGGEALHPARLEPWSKWYPNTGLINMFGITETTVHVTYKTIGRAEIECGQSNIGRPIPTLTSYVLDARFNLVPFGVPGELFVGGLGVGRGYVNMPQLTAERFIPNPFVPGGRLYRSGDRVRLLENGDMEYLGRIDFQVQVKGYRIELGEIETRLSTHPGVKSAVVTAGQLHSHSRNRDLFLCGYIVPDMETEAGNALKSAGSDDAAETMKTYLMRWLPEYMVPAYMILLDTIPLTANGKIDKNALPEPLEIGADNSFIAPRNDVERQLAEIWARVLDIPVDRIGIDSVFFNMGGHSLNATIILSNIHKTMDAQIPLAELFRAPTIRGLSRYISRQYNESDTGNAFTAVEQQELREYYPLSSAQKRLFLLDRLEDIGTSYNMPAVFDISGELDIYRMETAFSRLIERHESLRTSFHIIDGAPVQRVHDPGSMGFRIERFTIDVGAGFRDKKQQVRQIMKRFSRAFDLSSAPLLRVGLIEVRHHDFLLLFDLHHIVGDGTSMGILADDFVRFFIGEELQPLVIQYRDFAVWQNHLFESGGIADQEEYWRSLYPDQNDIPVLELPTDYSRPPVFTFAGDYCEFRLNTEDTSALRQFGDREGATLFMTLLTVLNILLYKYTGQEDIVVGTGIMGRRHADFQDLIGMFVNSLALRNNLTVQANPLQLLAEIKKTTLNAFENQDVQFEDLVNKLNPDRDMSRNPLFDVVLVVQNYESGRKELPSLTVSPYPMENCTAKFDLTFFFFEDGDELVLILEYYTALFSSSTARRLASHFISIARAVSAHSEGSIMELDFFSPNEKKLLLEQFNDTLRDFSSDVSYHHLFKQSASRFPDAVAATGPSLTGRDLQLTYREMDKASNLIASYLCSSITPYSFTPGMPVGVLMEPSVERLIALLGILKSGGAFVPLDPNLPRERLSIIIRDAGIGRVISQNSFLLELNRLQWECPGFHSFICLDSDDVLHQEETVKNRLMDPELWKYVADTAENDIQGGGWVSSYTGEPLSRKEMDEYVENTFLKLNPLLRKDLRVLEIGCASGLTMFRIAPYVGFYMGTDLSAAIIEKNRETAGEKHINNISLACLQAHEIGKLEEKNFDLVIINSVIQCFHGHNYLRGIIESILPLMANRGHLFIGDVMDLELKDALIDDLKAFQLTDSDKNYTTKTDFSQELFLSREFFTDLTVDFPSLNSVSFSLKHHTVANELTRFRYDVLFSICQEPIRSSAGIKKKYQHDRCTLSRISSEFDGEPPAGADNPAYIIFTSGSTGVPKGVVVGHRSLVNLCSWHNRYYHIKPSDRATQFAGIGFDASVWEIFPYLLEGAALNIVEDRLRLDAGGLSDFFASRCITVAFLPTQMCELIMEEPNDGLPLRLMLTGGDKLTRFQSASFKLYNNYGPTESTVVTTAYPLENPHSGFIPIGKPIDNTYVYIMDIHTLKLQPVGVPGELCVAGTGLAIGYLNRPELTAEKFISCDLLETGGNEKITLYKTGDLACWLPDGNIRFMGRIDQQVKVRGFRIELEEIEKHLLLYPNVKEAVVTAPTDETGNRGLCGFVVPVTDDEVEDSLFTAELKDYLSQRLPDYMVPPVFFRLPMLPVTASGKVDRKALASYRYGAIHTASVPPRSNLEKKMAELWADVLKIAQDGIGIDDDFFAVGGHSLRATMLISKIHKTLEIKIPLEFLFKTPTIRGLCNYILGCKSVGRDIFASIQPAPKQETYPLSSVQRRLFFLALLGDIGTAYNISYVLSLEGELELSKLEAVFAALIERHEILRTSFYSRRSDNRPVQKVHDMHNEMEFAIDYRELPPDTGDDEIRAIAAEFIRPFKLDIAPLIRVALLKLTPQHHIMMIDLHHIIADGISVGILVREFMEIYSGKTLPPPHLHYRDYAVWETGTERENMLIQQETYWLERMSGELPAINLPIDFSRTPDHGFSGGVVSFQLNEEETAALKDCIAAEEVTLFMALLAVTDILLWKISRQEDIIVGTPVAARRHEDLQDMIGMFVNTLALRQYLSGQKVFRDFLIETRDRSLKDFENQEYPLESLVEKVAGIRDNSRNPLFDVMFSLQNIDISRMEIPGLVLKPVDFDNPAVQFDLDIAAVEVEDRIHVSIKYNVGLFKNETALRLGRYFKSIACTISKEPGIQLAYIDILDQEEKERILEFATGIQVEYAKDKSVCDLLGERAEKSPDVVALVKNNRYISYRQLDLMSTRCSRWLRKHGIGSGSIVGFMIERSLAGIIGLLGIVRAGAAYMPMAEDNPADRLRYMLNDSNARALMVKRGNKLNLGENNNNCHNRLSLDIFNKNENTINDGFDDEIDLVFVDSTIEETTTAPQESTGGKPATNDPVYIIYTSGTTGKPKGVLVDHRNLVNFVTWFGEKYRIRTGLSVLQMYDITFDPSVEQIFCTLTHGATLFLLDRETLLDQEALQRYINVHQVEMIGFVPSLLNALFSREEKMPGLRYVLTAGERLDNTVKDKILKKGHTLHNLYGPTETTIYTVTGQCGESPVTIGYPVPNSTGFLLDQDGFPVPIGVPGELYIGGDGLSRGYLNRPELTAEKFVKKDLRRLLPIFRDGTSSPVNSKPLTLYRSGDLGRYLDDGQIEFLGRIDHQVKIRGYRIELGEIENCLLGFDGINEAVVLAMGQDDKYLCAYIVPESNDGHVVELDKEKIKAHLYRVLPGYMVPAFFTFLDEMPLNQNKKIDRHALPKPGLDVSMSAPPRNGLERALAKIWSEILNLPVGEDGYTVGIDDNFFQLGGYSLKITQLAAAIKKRFGLNIQLNELFRKPTIRGMAGIFSGAGHRVFDEIEAVEKREYYPLSSAQERLFVVWHVDPDSVAYNMPSVVRLEGPLRRERLEHAFGQLIRRHESLRTAFFMIDERPVQRIEEDLETNIEYFDRLDHGYIETQIKRFVRPFELTQAPLLRIGLVREGTDSHILMTDMHHIVSDGLSIEILVREFIHYYNGGTLPALPIQYRDFSVWQKRELSSGVLQKHEEYWLEHFSGELPRLSLPTDHPRTNDAQFRSDGERFRFEIDGEQFENIKRVIGETGVTMFQFLLTVYKILLSRYSRQEDIVVGCPVAGRTHADLEPVVGMFVNMLPIRSRTGAEKTFRGFLADVKQIAFKAFENQAYQFEDLVAALGLQGETGRNPIFDAAFTYASKTTVGEAADMPGELKASYLDLDIGKAIFDLMLRSFEASDRLLMIFEYKTALWNFSSMEKYAERFIEIINHVTADVDIPLSRIDFTTDFITVESVDLVDDDNDFNF